MVRARDLGAIGRARSDLDYLVQIARGRRFKRSVHSQIRINQNAGVPQRSRYNGGAAHSTGEFRNPLPGFVDFGHSYSVAVLSGADVTFPAA